MSGSTNPLYGELVSMPHEDRYDMPDEEKAMEEQTHLMIEKAAYFIAQKRGFAPGFELQDWLEAEAAIKNNL